MALTVPWSADPLVRRPLRGVPGVILRVALSLGLVALTTLACHRLIPVNATTAGLAYLVAILVIATAWGLVESTVASIAAMLCFNYFFLPPVGTFTIADPQNWVALFAFLVTSITASQLSDRARRRTTEAVDRQREMERLYALSRAILLTDPSGAAAEQIARQIAHTFGSLGVALYERGADQIHRAGPEDLPGVDDKLRNAALEGTQFQDPASHVVVTSIRLGGDPIGSIAIRGEPLSDTALQALSNVVAIGLEKARSQEAANRAEAARQSQELKSTLLDAIAHEFKTPLTSVKAAATSLLSQSVPPPPEQKELLTIIDEEADRLARLVTEALQTARVEAGKLQLNRELHSAASLITTALRQAKPLTEGRTISVEITPELPLLFVDGDLIQLAIRQLIDNALKYSAPSAPVTVTAQPGRLGVSIQLVDQGPGIPPEEQPRIFEKFYRSRGNHREVSGTGMGLAIAREVVRAHGGDVTIERSDGRGSVFSIYLPAALKEKMG